MPVLLGATTFNDKQDEGVAFVLDVTEPKRAEFERQLLASLVEQAADLMAIADLEGGTPIYSTRPGSKWSDSTAWKKRGPGAEFSTCSPKTVST